MKFITGTAACAAAIACALPAAAATTQTLEVVSGTEFPRAVTVSAADPLGQTFTAFTDTLTSVGFEFTTLNNTANSDLSLSIYAGEALSGTSLFDAVFQLPATLTNRNQREWVDIAVPSLALVQGQTYSLVLTATSSRAALITGPGFSSQQNRFFGGDAYLGGRLITDWTGIYANCRGTANNCDANFRVTGDLIAAAVPEPSSWALLILGFGVVGGALRRARKPRVALTFA